MGWPSHFEDDADKQAANLAENLTGEELHYLLSKVGWQQEHTKIVKGGLAERSPRSQKDSEADGRSTGLSTDLLFRAVVARLKSDQRKIEKLRDQIAPLKTEIAQLKNSRDRWADKCRSLQTKLKDVSTVRTHRR